MPDDTIVQYILANRERYTREALREQLVAAGHDEAAIDAGFRAADAIARAAGRLDLRPRAAVIAAVGYGVGWLLFGLYLSAGSGSSGVSGALALYLGLGLLISLAVISVSGGLRRADPTSVVTALAAGLVIPLVILVGLIGFCIWFIGQLRF